MTKRKLPRYQVPPNNQEVGLAKIRTKPIKPPALTTNLKEVKETEEDVKQYHGDEIEGAGYRKL